MTRREGYEFAEDKYDSGKEGVVWSLEQLGLSVNPLPSRPTICPWTQARCIGKMMLEMRDYDIGYLSENYARSFAEWGSPVRLPRSGTWILKRSISGGKIADFIGLYPLFCCADWCGVARDLEDISSDGISISCVSDPFANISESQLQELFPDCCRVFKKHYISDLRHSSENSISPHHRRNTRRALRRLAVETCPSPAEFLDDWCELYSGLVKRHRIEGLLRFSRDHFRHLFSTPGFQLFRAVARNRTVGLTTWVIHERVAYWHLSAYSPEGYKRGAPYALMQHAREALKERVRWLALGGVAGSADGSDGLAYFKRGWSTETRQVYLCGRVFDSEKYGKLSAAVPATDGYFPAYRVGEFK